MTECTSLPENQLLSSEARQLRQEILTRAQHTDIAALLQEAYPTGIPHERLITEVVRNYRVDPLAIASEMIHRLPSGRLEKPALNVTYQNLLALSSPEKPIYTDFLAFVADHLPDPEQQTSTTQRTPEETQRQAFHKLTDFSFTRIAQEMDEYIVHLLFTQPDVDLIAYEKTLEGMFDFLLSHKAKPYLHAAMALEREARETTYFHIGRVSRTVYTDPSHPIQEQPHFTFANQDAQLVLELPSANGPIVVMVGADGISMEGVDRSGIGHSEEVSHYAVLRLAELLMSTPEITTHVLANAFTTVNSEVYEKYSAEHFTKLLTYHEIDEEIMPRIPGTTLFAAVLKPNGALYCSVGDSYITKSTQAAHKQLNIPDSEDGLLTMHIGIDPEAFTITKGNVGSVHLQPGEHMSIHSDGITPKNLTIARDEAALHPTQSEQHIANAAIEAQMDQETNGKVNRTFFGTPGIFLPPYTLRDDASIIIAQRNLR